MPDFRVENSPIASGSTPTSFTQGSVVFAGAGVLAQDNANLFWDDANNRLGIGTASPISKLDISGGSLSVDGNAGYIRLRNAADSEQASFKYVGDSALEINANRGGTSANIKFKVQDVTKVTILDNGNVGIGTTSPQTKLALVSGSAISFEASAGVTDIALTHTADLLTFSGGKFSISDTTASTSTTTGSLINAGGFGNAGNAHIGGVIVSGATITSGSNLVATNSIQILSKTDFSAPSDGLWLVTNQAGTDFGRFMLGGSTSSFPAIKRSTTFLEARLADDSAYTTMRVGTAAVGAKVGGVIFDHYADAGNTGTGEDDLYTDTTAASTLGTNGDKITATYQGIFVGAVASTQELRVYFGGTKIYDSGALAIGVATNNWTVNVMVIRESSTVVRCSVSLSTDFGTLFPYSTYTRITGLTLTNTQILKLTGEATGAGALDNQIVAKLGYLKWESAA